MDSDIGTLLFVTSLLGAGGLGIYYYGSDSLNLIGGNDDDSKEDDSDIKEDELEELDDSFFTPPARSRRTNLNSTHNRSKRAGKRVRFNTKRRY